MEIIIKCSDDVRGGTNIYGEPIEELVRCKDCTHYNAGFECLIEGYGIERPPMWYCADGERKESE